MSKSRSKNNNWARSVKNSLGQWKRSIERLFWTSAPIRPPYTYTDKQGVEHKIAVPTVVKPGFTYHAPLTT